MKYEVIKEYPGCGQIKKGYTVDVKYAYGYDNGQRCVDGFTCSINTRYMSHVYKDEKSDILQITLDFHPSNYPEFFKRIEDEPKWANHTVIFNMQKEDGLNQIPIKLRNYGLFTEEDMIEFARFVFRQWSTPDTVFLNEWVSKKLKS